LSVPVEPIYLIIRDAALRSSLTAWLGLSGHTIVAVQDLDALLLARPSATGLFVVEHDLLPPDRDAWEATLNPLLPCARCIVLAAGEGGQHGALLIADRRGALPTIQMTIARIEGRQLVG